MQTTRTGELPLELIRMKCKGCQVELAGNNPGFTLPSNIGELGDSIVSLNLSQCSLRGSCITKQTQRMTRETGEQYSEPFCIFHAERSPRVPVHRHHPGVNRRAEQPAEPLAPGQCPLGYVCVHLV